MDGRQLKTGDRVPVNKTVIVQVGNGIMADDDSLHYVDYHSVHPQLNSDIITEGGEEDDFEEVE